MKKICKLLHINDGSGRILVNGNFHFMEELDWAAETLDQYLAEGFAVRQMIPQVCPVPLQENSYAFTNAGFLVYLEKEIPDIDGEWDLDDPEETVFGEDDDPTECFLTDEKAEAEEKRVESPSEEEVDRLSPEEDAARMKALYLQVLNHELDFQDMDIIDILRIQEMMQKQLTIGTVSRKLAILYEAAKNGIFFGDLNLEKITETVEALGRLFPFGEE